MSAAPIPREQITGLVLAGGQGSRMGGADKGLLPWQGGTLAGHALARLAPQVGPLLISANRHLDRYAVLGVPVCRDDPPEFAGPLAGLLAGLRHGDTPWLAFVPCDSPLFPADLVDRLATAALAESADLAIAATREPDGRLARQPVFGLVRRPLAASLAEALSRGERRLGQWADRQRRVLVPFDDAAAFANANTPADLALLKGSCRDGDA
jgi:molybdenum cofactor guanylyltransferase